MTVATKKLDVRDCTRMDALRNGWMTLSPLMTSGDYTLLRRWEDQTYIVAYGITIDDVAKTCTWCQGYYDRQLGDALQLFLEKIS